MRKYCVDSIVLKNRKLNHDTFVLDLKVESDLTKVIPGQFIELLINDYNNAFLRRPFSIHDVDSENNVLSILIKIVGNGTNYLSDTKEGDILNIIFPLGNGFSILSNKKVLLTGGGCGIAPLFYLAKELKSKSNKIDILLGARSKEDLFEIDEFGQLGNLYTTTNDGTSGENGLITEHSLFKSNMDYDLIYSCGPEIMMKNIAKIAKSKNIECEVSLENTMACGIGACLCCVTDTINGNVCVCTEGPVFNVKNLKWQI